MKKKILAITLCVSMLAIAIVGGTLAYFTDTHTQTNTFVAGNVGISLDEAKVKLDNDPESNTFGDLIADGTNRTTETQEYHLFPGMTVTKDPTITVDSDSEEAFIAAKVIITSGEEGDIESLIGSGYMNLLAIHDIVEGGYAKPNQPMQQNHPLRAKYPQLPEYGDAEYGTSTYSVFQQANPNGGANNNGEYVLYIFAEGKKAAGAEVVLFENIIIPDAWNNREMAIMNGVTIKVEAYAVQANGFADCYTAMTSAFGQNAGDPFYFA